MEPSDVAIRTFPLRLLRVEFGEAVIVNWEEDFLVVVNPLGEDITDQDTLDETDNVLVSPSALKYCVAVVTLSSDFDDVTPMELAADSCLSQLETPCLAVASLELYFKTSLYASLAC